MTQMRSLLKKVLVDLHLIFTEKTAKHHLDIQQKQSFINESEMNTVPDKFREVISSLPYNT